MTEREEATAERGEVTGERGGGNSRERVMLMMTESGNSNRERGGNDRERQ